MKKSIVETGTKIRAAILISAKAEWMTVSEAYPNERVDSSPLGDFFTVRLAGIDCLFFHGGWGKGAAAAGTQYVIDRWHPELVLNIGTCGGLDGNISVGEVILADETVIYDIYERMGDPQEALDHYTTKIDLSYLHQPYPHYVRVCRLVSGDQDIDPAFVNQLKSDFHAVAADWESGAIAWTAASNNTRVLILRVVSDLVSATGGELYESGDFSSRTREVMQPLLSALQAWLRCAFPG